MSPSAAAVAQINADIERTLGSMRTQLAAFRRMAAPEVMAAYPRIAAAIGRADFRVSREYTKEGLKELIEEAELLAWDVPALLGELFTEKWIQACFTANDVYPDTVAYHLYDYLRRRGDGESPFPRHFAETLHQAFHPLGRLLMRSGFQTGNLTLFGNEEARPDTLAYARLAEYFTMHPTMTAGAQAFGNQARRCHELRQSLVAIEDKLAREEAQARWDEVEQERNRKED